MVAQKEEELTPLQRQIIHAVAKGGYCDTSTISDRTGASASYIREVRSRFADEITRLQDESNFTYETLFGEPYSIYIRPDLQDELHIRSGDIVKVTFEEDGDQKTTHGEVKEWNLPVNDPRQQELHARILGCYQAGEEIRANQPDAFETFDLLDDGRIKIATADAFQRYLNLISYHYSDSVANADILIGAGIVEISTDERQLGNLIENELFKLEAEDFADYLLGEGPNFVDIEIYTGDISEPDSVYFTYYGRELDDEHINSLREDILDQEYFRSDWNYTLPNGATVVGPTTVSETSQLIRIAKDALEVVPGVRQQISVAPEGAPTESPELTLPEVRNAIEAANPRFENLATHSRYGSNQGGLPIREHENSILFLFDQVTVSLSIEDNTLRWEYPSKISNVRKIKEAVTDMIASQLELTAQEQSPEEPSGRPVSDTTWVFDTNTLYHDFVADNPTSILHTLLPHEYFYDADISIPWIVLYEMNKHPDRGSATEATNAQGFENLNIMRFLDEIAFLNLEVESAPSEITTDVGLGDIADMYVLHFTHSEGDYLITGDESLREIAVAMDIPAINVSELATLSSPVDGEGLVEEVKSSIGQRFETRDEILTELQSMFEPSATLPPTDSTQQTQQSNPEDLLDSWIRNDEIVAYYNQSRDALQYTQAEPITVTVGISVLSAMDEFIDESGGERYLTRSFLKQVRNGVRGLSNIELPLLTFTVPIEYITQNATDGSSPSDFNRTVFKLQQTENSKYKPKPALQREAGEMISRLGSATGDLVPEAHNQEPNAISNGLIMEDYLAIALAASTDIPYVLLPEDYEHLVILARLIGTQVVPISISQDNDCTETSQV